MDDLSWTGKVILAVAFALSFFATQGIMGMADAGTYFVPQFPPHVNVCKPIMADSTPLVFPYPTNAVLNPTASWGVKSITLRKFAFLATPHQYAGKKICIADPRIGGAAILDCEAVLNHGRKETYRVISDSVYLFPSTLK